MTDFAARVKRETLDLHAATERAFAPFDLRVRSGYAAFLRAQAGAVLPLEQAADDAGLGAWLPDWPARRRADLLRADLRALGMPAPGPTGAGTFDPVGIAYVLEGSRHGARVLLRDALAGGDPAVAAATRFLRHVPGPGWWRSFLDALAAYGAEAARADAVLAGAAGAFGLFLRSAAAISRSAPALEA